MWELMGSNGWMPETDYYIRLVASLILGGLVGLEREIRDKPAGLRTIILICVGACLFTMISQIVGGPDWNSTRIAAQIVTGIGFLGAGAIMRGQGSVMGLTTAATIWAVAAIGMAVGFGQVALGVLGTVVILIALFLLSAIEHRIGQRRDIQVYHIKAPNADETLGEIDRLFQAAGMRVRKRRMHEDGEQLVYHIVAMGAKDRHEQLHHEIARSDRFTLLRA